MKTLLKICKLVHGTVFQETFFTKERALLFMRHLLFLVLLIIVILKCDTKSHSHSNFLFVIKEYKSLEMNSF